MKPTTLYTPPYRKPSALDIACATFARTIKRKTPRPNDRVTDNRAAFHHRLETARSATRRTHLDEPATDARFTA